MVHSLLVTCVSPHEAIVYTGPHTPRLECFIRTTPHQYNTSIKHHSTITKPAADTLRRLGCQLHESAHNHLSRFKSNKVHYYCPSRIRSPILGTSDSPLLHKTPTCLSSSAPPTLFARGSSPPRHAPAMPSPCKMPQQHR